MEEELYLQLYKKQSKIIFFYLLKHGCSKQDAEDIIQESFIKLLEYCNEINEGSEASWLFKVALNNFRNRYKKQLRHPQLVINEMDFKEIFQDEPERQLLQKEESHTIIQCLHSMKEAQRELLILKYEMNLSYREIAELLGTKEEQIKIYLYRSRNAFKKIWGDRHESR